MTISIEDFKKIEIKIGKIIEAENIEGSDKLLKLKVDFNEDNPRQVLSGIKSYFSDPSVLIGKKCAFATNLEPRKMMGLESQAMILAVSGDDFFSVLSVEENTPQGSVVK